METKEKDFLCKNKCLVFLLSCFVNNFYLVLCTLIGAIMLSINIQVGFNMILYLCLPHAHLCFDKFAILNLHSLRRHRGCIVVLSRVDI